MRGMGAAGHSKEITFNTIGNVVTLFFQWLIIMLIPKITDLQRPVCSR